MTVRTSGRGRAAVLALALAAVLAACGSAPTLDDAATERAVGRAVAADVDPTVSATRCAGDLKKERGGTFTCTVTLKGVGPLPVEVRQTDDQGTLEVTPTSAVVTKERIATELSASLKQRFGRSFEVTCSGAPIEVRAPGSTSTCGAKDATSKREVTVTVDDASGTLAFAVADA